MPLIFAVDSDKRQSTQLAALLRSHVDAELVQSATVLDGIGVLEGRIPDLVLTSSLLSPRDESALANHLRELGARGDHVHTLTIPVLAATRKASKKRPTGVLGALRREKSADVEAEGCQPEVFAKEVKIYLGRAVEERAGIDAASGEPIYTEPEYVEPQSAEPVDVEPVAVVEREAPDSDALMVQPPVAVADVCAPPETRVPVVDMGTFDDLDALAAQLAAPSEAEPTLSVPGSVSANDPFEQFFVPQPPGIVEAPPKEEAPAAVEPAPVAIPAVNSDTWFERMTAAVRDETPVKPEPPQAPEPVFSWIDNQTASSLSDVLSRVRASDSDAHQRVPTRPAAPTVEEAPAQVVPMAAVEAEAPMEIAVVARPEVVVELVLPPAAPFLDPDVLAMFGAAVHRAGLDALESLSRPKPVAGDHAVPMPTPERLARIARESKAERRSRRKPPRPAQDEWGMYDPNQCGSAALFDEDAWNEVEADEKVPARRPRVS